MVKAYKNEEFMMGEEARTLRILAEYIEPQMRFRRLGILRSIIFFGSARLRANPSEGLDYYTQAAQLAEQLARWTLKTHAEGNRFHICSGGGPGIMEAAHLGAARVDRRLNVGLNISLPMEQHVNNYIEPERAFEFHYFFMRKFWFKNLAHAMVVFPGGFGTMDELFEVLTLAQTGRGGDRIPIVLFGTEFWRSSVNFDDLLRRQLISPEDLELFHLVDSVDGAYRYLVGELGKEPRQADPADLEAK